MFIKKLLSSIISFSLVVTLFPAGVLSAPISSSMVVPQNVFNDYAKITSQAFYDSDTLVINIQDLHNNKEVQSNIYKLLETLNNRYENIEIYMEGASENVDFTKLSSLGAKNVSLLMDNLFDNDKLSGVEYFGYKNNKILNSVEDKSVYDKNIQNYSLLIKNRKEIKNLLLKEYIKLKTLNKYLTKEQKEILSQYNKYLNNKISRAKFCRFLYKQMVKRNIPDWRYPNSKLYHDITKAGKYINQNKVHSQLQSVLSYLKGNLSYQAYSEFVKKSNNLSDVNFVFSYLSENISKEEKLKYPDLFKMIKIREISSLINPLDLVEEDRQKVEDILLIESTTVKNKDIVFLNLFFSVYSKMLMAEMSSKEYEYYKQSYNLYSDIYIKYLNDDSIELDYYRRIAEEFNELNLKRNNIFFEKIKATENNKNEAKGNKILVLVSGGFHTEGLSELLDENKISHITFTPNIKKNDYLYEQEYLNSIVEQADADFNAISKRPWLENPQGIVRDIVLEMNQILPSLLEENKTTEQITETVNNKIKSEGVNDFIKFNLDKDGVATITVDGVLYPLNYQNGKIELFDGYNITTLAKNIKLLIRQILANEPFVRQDMGLPEKGYKRKPVEQMSPNQIAEMIFMEHNILFSNFANEIMKSLFKNNPNFQDRSKDRVYNMMLKQVRGEAFKDAEIIVSDSKSLIGVLPDGYGNTREYGLLFYVVWERDKFGAEKAKNILISNELLRYLENFDDKSLNQFFYDLFIHERLEHDALIGNNTKFNEYIFSNGLSLTSEVFHEYIKTPEFDSFIAKKGYNSSQTRLMEQMEAILSEVNKRNSEYSDILSLFSVNDQLEYSTKALDTFLSMRIGEQKVIDDSLSQLADRTYSQLKKMYIAQQQNINPDYNIKKDVDNFIMFLNKFVVVYRKTNEYMAPDKFAEFIKAKVKQEFSISEEKASEISIQVLEFKDFSTQDDSKKEETEFNKAIKSKGVLVLEDIISKKSQTFNNMYNYFMDKGAAGVYGLAFFDLSKEPNKEDNIISDKTLERILDKPSVLLNSINNVNGNVKKYVAYYLTSLLANDKGIEIIKQISALDNEVVKNLLHSLFNILNNREEVRGVQSYEIVNLILAIGFGKKVNITDISKEELDEFLIKYNIAKYKKLVPLEISYDDWKDDTPSLIIFAYMFGYEFIRAVGVNNIDGIENNYSQPNRQLIENMCRKYSISFEDIKRKLKHSYDVQDNEDIDSDIRKIKITLENARIRFKRDIQALVIKYDVTAEILDEIQRQEYLKKVEDIEETYKNAVKKVMLEAKYITLKRLKEQGIEIDEDLFLIMVGGSLAKGSMMSDSDVYYDIIVPDGTISKSIELRFAPLYSSILTQAGLSNYHVLKYSSTHMNKQNINTFVDEKEVAPFLNYEILSLSKEMRSLYNLYTRSVLRKGLQERESTLENLALINKRYDSVAKDGDGWMEGSFLISYDNEKDKVFSVRSVLMSLETKLNEIIFQYFAKTRNIAFTTPISIKEQIEFIKTAIYARDKKKAAEMDALFEAWQFLSSCRYISVNNSWTNFVPGARQAIKTINDFVLKNTIVSIEENEFADEKIEEITNNRDFLSVIENFVYDNSMDIEIFRNGYAKYAHLETWKNSADKKENEDLFLFAQAVSLLIDIDSPILRQKLSQIKIKGLEKYLEKLFKSMDAIKLIDEKFPGYSHIAGERSIQNYWDAVAKNAADEETMLALIAHKLTKAQVEKNKEKKKEDEYLLYAIYLPLAKRFGNAEMYEYVRNDLFQYSHPDAYLNLLKIIKTLYGIDYSKIPEINEDISEGIREFLNSKGFTDADFHINCRVKSLYSVYEKLNSSRRNDDDYKKVLKEADINAIRYILSFNGDLFDDIIRKAYPEKDINVDTIKEEILEYVDEKFDSLPKAKQKQLHDILAEMKNAVFHDYNVVDYINKYLSNIMDDCRNNDGSVNAEILKDTLEKEGKFFELWFIKLFEGDLKDFIGLHVVAEDSEYRGVTNIAKGSTIGADYQELKDFCKNRRNAEFATFKVDDENKQARLKIKASVKSTKSDFAKSGRMALPVELCFYERTDHENETYGLYNLKKMSAPHNIYKMGRNFISVFFENIFSKILDYSFLNKNEQTLSLGADADSKIEPKKMIFTADGFVPTNNFADNFNQAVSNFQDTVICFVEYDGQVYIQQLPKNATIFDLATSKYFSDDRDVSVYNEDGEPLTSNLVVKEYKTYKIIRGYDKIALPISEADIHTTRAKLIYFGEQTNKSFVSKAIKKMGSSEYILKLTDIILDNMKNENLVNEKKLRSSDIADRIYNEQVKNGTFDSFNKTEQEFKDDIIEFLKILSNFYNRNNLQDRPTSSILKRSVQIAAHYNLANVLELFEALDYGLIDFKDIESFYRTFVYIKTDSKDTSTDDIASEIAKYFNIIKVYDDNFNLVINDTKYRVEDAKSFDYDFMRQLMSIESLNLIAVSDKNDKKLSDDKKSIFITVDFQMPKEPFALMSLGNNVEQIIKNYAVSHPDMVRIILSMTEHIAYSDEVLSEEKINSLMVEYPVLMSQLLLGIYAQDNSAVLSQETPLLTFEETEFLKTEIQNEISVSNVNVVVAKSLDLVESENSYSFATLDVSQDSATLFISEAFLRMLDKLPANEKEYFLIQLALHETGEYKVLQATPGLTYSDYHKQISQNEGQKDLLDKADSVVTDVLKMKTALNKLNLFLQSQNIVQADISPNNISENLKVFTQILSDCLTDENYFLNEIPLDVLKDIIFLITVMTPEEKAEIVSAFKVLPTWKDSLEKIIDVNSNQFMFISEFVNMLMSDTATQRPQLNIQEQLEQPKFDNLTKEELSLTEQTSKIHSLMAAA